MAELLDQKAENLPLSLREIPPGQMKPFFFYINSHPADSAGEQRSAK